ncbi:MAG: hypothetical protein Q9162_003426 [Coniocarpon cinnabarinum]
MAAAHPAMLSPGQVVVEPVPEPQDEAWKLNLNRAMMCPDCQELPPNIMEDWQEGNTVCATCGLVLETHLVDQRSEWRTFASDDGKGDDPSRVGKAEDPNNPGDHLQTSISFNASGMRDRALDRAQASIYKDAGQQHLESAYSVIRQYCNSLHLPNTTEQKASDLFRKFHAAPQLRGKNQDAIKLACILSATRKNKNGISYDTMMMMSGVSKRDISRAFKSLKEAFRANLTAPASSGAGKFDAQEETIVATSASTMTSRYSSQLQLQRHTNNLARKIADHVAEVGTLDGRNPNTTAGACIFTACHLTGDIRSLKEVAKEAGVNDSTIKGAYRKLMEEKDRVILPEWLGEGKGDLSRLPQV